MINTGIIGMHKPFHSVGNILYPSRCAVLIGDDTDLLPCFQAVLD